ncbi:MAG: hypothetical protein M3Q39_16000 [Actinomycetota bacterium]|nr:hypothetical protein [Actinomycetota bacterium]
MNDAAALITASYDQYHATFTAIGGCPRQHRPGVEINVQTLHGTQGAALIALEYAYHDVRRQLIETMKEETPS